MSNRTEVRGVEKGFDNWTGTRFPETRSPLIRTCDTVPDRVSTKDPRGSPSPLTSRFSVTGQVPTGRFRLLGSRTRGIDPNVLTGTTPTGNDNGSTKRTVTTFRHPSNRPRSDDFLLVFDLSVGVRPGLGLETESTETGTSVTPWKVLETMEGEGPGPSTRDPHPRGAASIEGEPHRSVRVSTRHRYFAINVSPFVRVSSCYIVVVGRYSRMTPASVTFTKRR